MQGDDELRQSVLRSPQAHHTCVHTHTYVHTLDKQMVVILKKKFYCVALRNSCFEFFKAMRGSRLLCYWPRTKLSARMQSLMSESSIIIVINYYYR